MSKIINISDKLSNDKPMITIGEKEYVVNDSIETVLKFEESYGQGSLQCMLDCLRVALGKEAYDTLSFKKMSFDNVRVWFLAIVAAMQGMTYEEAEERFRQFEARS